MPVSFDLTWHTDATPYRWRLTTRYEMPCRVVGTIRVGNETFSFTGPGQRDHSWGARDWWGQEWMWNAFHLDDGTRLHQVTIVGLEGMAFGYVQKDGEVVELTSGASTVSLTDDGLASAGSFEAGDAGLSAIVVPVAWGPLRMEHADGRLAYFIRALAEISTADGRRGTGWVEWNHQQSPVS